MSQTRYLQFVTRVLHRQFVQTKLLLQLLELGRFRAGECGPDETVGPHHIFADGLDSDIAEPGAFLVCDAVNEQGDGNYTPGIRGQSLEIG